jgi:hypothetical protein
MYAQYKYIAAELGKVNPDVAHVLTLFKAAGQYVE